MKRSPLPPRKHYMPRKTSMPHVSKAKRHWRKEAARCQAEYRETHLRCGACGISVFARPARPLHLHHLCGKGTQRHECHANYLMLCDRDHRQFHAGGEFDDEGSRLPRLTGGMLLGAKREADGELDAALLASLRGWKGLKEEWEPVALPAVFLRERERNL